MTEVNKFEEWVLSKVPELSKSRSNKKLRKRMVGGHVNRGWCCGRLGEGVGEGVLVMVMF